MTDVDAPAELALEIRPDGWSCVVPRQAPKFPINRGDPWPYIIGMVAGVLLFVHEALPLAVMTLYALYLLVDIAKPAPKAFALLLNPRELHIDDTVLDLSRLRVRRNEQTLTITDGKQTRLLYTRASEPALDWVVTHMQRGARAASPSDGTVPEALAALRAKQKT